MSKKRALKVFVAMAFGRDDTDALYDKALKPLLTRPGDLRPVRVDRSDRNEPIDEQIYKFMKVSDFAVADLTYARPSVYYEAGWMRGNGKPVIFTCRADHLERGKPPEVADRLRVHFDLEQESIVAWRAPDDKGFRKRLSSRIRVVSEPLRSHLEKDRRREAEEAAFARLSPTDRCLALASVARFRLRRAGFRKVRVNGRYAVGVRTDGAVRRGVRVIIKDHFSKHDFQSYYFYSSLMRGPIPAIDDELDQTEWFFVSLRRVRASTIQAVFTRFAVTSDGTTLHRVTEEGGRSVQHIVHVLADSRSKSQFRGDFDAKLGLAVSLVRALKGKS